MARFAEQFRSLPLLWLLLRTNGVHSWRRLLAIRQQSRLLTGIISFFVIGYLVLAFAAVEVGQKVELTGVACPKKVLPIDVQDVDLLVAQIEFIEVRISVLLEHLERGHVPLPAVIVVIPKEPHAEIGVVENQAAEIASHVRQGVLTGALLI